jgi:RNA polymerase primary sigma factor
MTLKQRASRLLELKLLVFVDTSFKKRSQHPAIIGDMPDLEGFAARQAELWKEHGDLPPELRQMYVYPLLSREQEFHLFRKYNFYKWQIVNRRKLFDFNDLDEKVIVLCEQHMEEAAKVRQLIAGCNVRLVVGLVKKNRWYKTRPSPDRLMDMTSDGNMGIYAAIDYFDFRKGNKFSTYATYAVRDWLTKGVVYESRMEQRFLVGMDEILDILPDRDQEEKPEPNTLVRRLLKTIEDTRTRNVLDRYFRQDQTLAVIGDDLGLSKERVRQIREKGLKIIRDYIGRNPNCALNP